MLGSMQGVMVVGIVIVGHIEPCNLILYQLVDMVGQSLAQYIAIHPVENTDNTI